VAFDKQHLIAALKPGCNLHFFDTVASTNQTLWDLLEQGEKTGSVVIATQQTAGRGQWGRQWISSDGGLYFSMAISCELEASNSYQLTLASAWGIAKKLQQSGIPVEIKWPNDLVLNGRKLGGILTETKVSKGKITQAVIGVGINWANPVPETGINLLFWQALYNSQAINSLEILAYVVLQGIESGLECLLNEGTTTLLSRYIDLLANMGEKVYVRNQVGTVIGVTPNGELRVCTGMGIKDIKTKNSSDAKATEICLQPGTISLGYSKFSD
jgi:BirA family transcriptional regulator, biotin operon repressor / biotin---[acetyl-CoA-carboxylase] ligase